MPGGITDITGIRDELMIATKDGHILRLGNVSSLFDPNLAQVLVGRPA